MTRHSVYPCRVDLSLPSCYAAGVTSCTQFGTYVARFIRSLPVLPSLFVIMGLVGCTHERAATPSSVTNGSQNENRAEPGSREDVLVNPLASSLPNGIPRAEEAWSRFVENGRYHLAAASDFHFPAKAWREQGYDT